MLKIIQFYNFLGSTKRVLHFKTFLAKWNVIGAEICFNTPRSEVCTLQPGICRQCLRDVISVQLIEVDNEFDLNLSM